MSKILEPPRTVEGCLQAVPMPELRQLWYGRIKPLIDQEQDRFRVTVLDARASFKGLDLDRCVFDLVHAMVNNTTMRFTPDEIELAIQSFVKGFLTALETVK